MHLLATTPAPANCLNAASINAEDFGRVDALCVNYPPVGEPSVTFTQVNSPRDVRVLEFKAQGPRPILPDTCWSELPVRATSHRLVSQLPGLRPPNQEAVPARVMAAVTTTKMTTPESCSPAVSRTAPRQRYGDKSVDLDRW
jgi:hypothetical protein